MRRLLTLALLLASPAYAQVTPAPGLQAQDEGTPLGFGTTLNMTGAGVACTMASPPVIVCTITGAGSPNLSTITDDAGCTGDQAVRRNAGDTLFECYTPSALSGSGTTNRITKWSGTSTLGDSGAIDTTSGVTTMTFAPTSISIGGYTHATPASSNYVGVSGTGTDIAGGAVSLDGGASTGTGAGGDLNLRITPPAAGSGSSQNAVQTAVAINGANGSVVVGGVNYAGAGALEQSTFRGTDVATGVTDKAGGNVVLGGGQSTGSGVGGTILMQVSPAGGSGSAQNALQNILTAGVANQIISTQSDYCFGWSASTTESSPGSIDTTLCRSAAGVTIAENIAAKAQGDLCVQDSAGGDQYCFQSEATAPAGTTTLTLNIDAATCTGDGNLGALTINGSNEIVCSADDGGAGSGDSIRVEDGDNGGTFTAMTDMDIDDSGDINFTRAAGPPDVLTATVRANAVALGTDTTSDYVAEVQAGLGLIESGSPAETATAVVSIDHAQTLAGDPALGEDACIHVATATGGGLLCEGGTANTNEMLFLIPDLDEADTTHRLVTESATQTLTSKTLTAPVIGSYLDMAEAGAPATPGAGVVRLYAKNTATAEFCSKDDAGTETCMSAGSGGGGLDHPQVMIRVSYGGF